MPPKIAFPRMGNYTLAFELLIEELGGKTEIPQKTTSNDILEAVKICPEMYCFPFKANVANYLKAIERGAQSILMVTSQGSCRLRYYGVLQEKILKEKKGDIQFIIFDQNLKDLYSTLKKLFGKSFFEILKSFFRFWKRIKIIEEMERISNLLRPREKKKGETDKVFREGLLKLKKFKKKKLSLLRKEIFKDFSKIEIEKEKKLPKVGIVGEIFMACEPDVNFEIERKLGYLGVEVHKEITLSYHLSKKLFFKDFFIYRKIKNYLQSPVGGHGGDAVYEMLKYIKKGFDGVIQILPFACMPEVTVRPILEKIHQKYQIPFLSLSIDEHTAEAGLLTRLEAFVDVVNSYFQRKK